MENGKWHGSYQFTSQMDKHKCENYRPILILPIIGKIFERSVSNQVYSYLNDNSLLSKYQVGFRPKNSCLTALIQMCDEWYTNMDKVI